MEALSFWLAISRKKVKEEIPKQEDRSPYFDPFDRLMSSRGKFGDPDKYYEDEEPQPMPADNE